MTLTSLFFIRKTDFAEKQGLLVCIRIHAYAVVYACVMLYIVYKLYWNCNIAYFILFKLIFSKILALQLHCEFRV